MSSLRSSPAPTKVFRGHAYDVMSLAFIGDAHLASGDVKGNLRLWNISELETTSQKLTHGGESILGLRSCGGITSGGILSHGRDGRILEWEYGKSGELTELGEVCTGLAEGFCKFDVYSTEGKTRFSYLAAAESERSTSIGIYAGSGDQVASLTQREKSWGMCTALQFHDEYNLVSGHEDGRLRLWDLRAGSAVAEESISDEPIFALARHPVDGTFVCGGASSDVVSFKIASNEFSRLQAAILRNPGVSQMCFRSDGRILVVACWDGGVRVFGTKSGKDGQLRALASLRYHEAMVHCCAAHGVGGLFASSGDDRRIALWDVYAGKMSNV
eukprot:CAMPEP_0113961944 /NCGR_PEP_ID=MMETSP0011_2-20120614/5622_1 /TAXON_ID=101924 /ORGANISM="Rhodosorus marinus" /LENGTH=328 /DNA_ID=CAMNT_0000973705 /DNA_START=177 /DNA_END=1163 /DNA_ORIENTATION=- /assembly_acc=CAM_ASM_000156